MRVDNLLKVAKGSIGKQVHRAETGGRGAGFSRGHCDRLYATCYGLNDTPPSKSSGFTGAQDEQNHHGKEEKGAGELRTSKRRRIIAMAGLLLCLCRQRGR